MPKVILRADACKAALDLLGQRLPPDRSGVLIALTMAASTNTSFEASYADVYAMVKALRTEDPPGAGKTRISNPIWEAGEKRRREDMDERERAELHLYERLTDARQRGLGFLIAPEHTATALSLARLPRSYVLARGIRAWNEGRTWELTADDLDMLLRYIQAGHKK